MSLHLSRRGALALLASLGSAPALAACAPADGGGGRTPPFRDTSLGCDLGEPEPVALAHATRFSMDRFPAGEVLLCLANGERHLVLPEGAEPPRGLAGDVSALRRPLSDVYLVSTAMICVLDAIGALDAVGLASVTAEDCPVEALAARIEEGAVAYGGRYDAPDYELVAGRACPLALENNKVNNVPEVRRKLGELGVAVLTEQSSDEPEVLGRVEWLRLAGVLFGREDEAAACLEGIEARVAELAALGPTGRTIAFFYVNSDGAVATRRSTDYFARMVELAGGTYLGFDPEGDDGGASESSQLVVDPEEFYVRAREADVVVYNTTVDAGVTTLDDLVSRNALLADLKAVRAGEAWACDHSMYQQMTSVDQIVAEIRGALAGEGGDGRFLWRLG